MGTKIVSVDNGGRVLSFPDEKSYPTSFSLGTDILHGQINRQATTLLCGFANNLHLVDIDSHNPGQKIQVSGNINDCGFGSEGQLLAVTNKNLLVVNQADTNKDIKLPEEGTAVAYLDGIAWVGTKRGQLISIDLATGVIKEVAQIGSGKITRIVLGNQKNLLAVGCSSGLLAFYSLNNKALVSQDLKYHNMPITCVEFSPDDTHCLSSAYEKDMHYWDTVKFKHISRIESRLSSPRRPQVSSRLFQPRGGR